MKPYRTFRSLKRIYWKPEEGLFTGACSDWTRGNGFNLKEGKFGLDIGKKFFNMRAARCSSRLLRKVVNGPSLEVSEDRLDEALGNLV